MHGSGPSEQHRNKTESKLTIRHLPTGLAAHCESSRSQGENRALALTVLRARLWEQARAREGHERGQQRRAQIGSGERGDKRRTIRTQDGIVTDHLLGKRWRL